MPQNAYCDKELAESNAKKSDKTDKIHKPTTKIEQIPAKIIPIEGAYGSLGE